MTGDGFPYPVDRPSNFAVKSEDITAEQLLPFGYAPGGYMMKCPTCRAGTYNVDKRARRCWQCAVNAFRAHAQHQSLADLAEAEEDREIDRILAMSGDELRAELVAEGHDPDALVRQMKQGLDGTLRLAADRQRWREEAASWRRVAERLETEMQELLSVCDCEIRDQTNNRRASDKRSAAFAEGALRVAKGIARRIREKSEARR